MALTSAELGSDTESQHWSLGLFPVTQQEQVEKRCSLLPVFSSCVLSWTYLPSVSAGQSTTNQCPPFPTPHGARCWWVHKNQTILLNGCLDFAKHLAMLQHTKEFVTEFCLHERWFRSCPQGNLMKVTLNALNTSSELRHHLETMSW